MIRILFGLLFSFSLSSATALELPPLYYWNSMAKYGFTNFGDALSDTLAIKTIFCARRRGRFLEKSGI